MMALATGAVSSSSSATVAVEKATSDLLIGPDWTINIDICDSVNSHHWQAKDVVKAVKKRLQHKNPKVQLLALTLLETMVKNCGDYVHFQIAEKNILGEMVKIVKKKSDMHVRDKILVLLDSWQEAFGGPGGKYPQYYWAYEELRRNGVAFPQRSLDSAPIFTPPVTHPTVRHAEAGYGMPSNSSRRLDETMATDTDGLSLSSLESMHNCMELLNDMLQAVNPHDREAVKDDIIVDLVNQCRSNQKKLMQMLTSTGDEVLLGQGLELNDSLQILLAKHDAIASGSPIPTQIASSNLKPSEEPSSNIKPTEVRLPSPISSSNPVSPEPPVTNVKRSQIDEEEEEEDDFAQLARRHTKTQSSSSQGSSVTGGALVLADTGSSSSPPASTSNALALPDPPAPVKTTKEQDMIDLLSLTLSTISTSPHPQTPRTPASSQTMPHTPPASNQTLPQIPVSSGTQGYPYGYQTYPGNQGQVPYNSYVVPWAQPPPQQQFLPQQQFQHQPQPQFHPQPQQQFQPAPQPQFQSQYPQHSSAYPPPPWAATPGYANGQNHMSASNNNNMFSTSQANSTVSYSPVQTARPLQHYNSFPSKGINGSTMNGDTNVNPLPKTPTAPGQKPFIPSYRLFEDLNVLGNADGRFKMTSSTSSLSGTPGQSMVGGRK